MQRSSQVALTNFMTTASALTAILNHLPEPVARSFKPAVYEGGIYQRECQWVSPDDEQPEQVIVIDNFPSQANRVGVCAEGRFDEVRIGVSSQAYDCRAVQRCNRQCRLICMVSSALKLCGSVHPFTFAVNLLPSSDKLQLSTSILSSGPL